MSCCLIAQVESARVYARVHERARIRKCARCACACERAHRLPCCVVSARAIFAITAEQSEVECDATGSSFESSRALPLFLLKGKGVVADKASAKHIDTGGALGVVKKLF